MGFDAEHFQESHSDLSPNIIAWNPFFWLTLPHAASISCFSDFNGLRNRGGLVADVTSFLLYFRFVEFVSFGKIETLQFVSVYGVRRL